MPRQLASINPRQAVSAALVAVAATAGIAVAATPAQAAVVDNGIFTGSVYLSRSETRYVAARMGVLQAGATPSLVAGCGALALVPAPGANIVLPAACLGVVGVYGTAFKNATASAARGNGCLRIRYTRTRTPVIVGFYNDGGRHCKN
jgi:hypothetical protein